jgi:hypothetical protein
VRRTTVTTNQDLNRNGHSPPPFVFSGQQRSTCLNVPTRAAEKQSKSALLDAVVPFCFHMATTGPPPQSYNMPTTPIILAENYGPLYAIFTVICLSPVVAGLVGLILVKRWPWVGLVCGWMGVIVGGLLFLMFLTTTGGAAPAFWLVASFPFVMGILCLVRWKTLRKPSS